MVVTINPTPSVTNSITSYQICSATYVTIPLQSNVAGTSFSWTASGSSPNVTGYSNSSGTVIQQNLTNSGFNIETVTYTVIPTANGCIGNPTAFTVTVFPVPDVYFTPASQTFCSGGTANLILQSHVTGATFTWTATGSSPNVTGYSPGSGTLIQQTLNNSGNLSETVNYAANPTANGCPGGVGHAIVTVNPWPVVSLITCWDPVTTTDAQPIKLKGGIPLGGIWSGVGVNLGIFYPSVAGIGTYSITYSYTNASGCVNVSSQTINVISPPAFTCGNILTDVRDNNQYSTVQLGSQCWMAANLVYGTTIDHTQMQGDNCVAEKYCYNDLPANCTSFGGLYQWDELMKYDNTSMAQGFCPSGWHIPSEGEWNTLLNVMNGPAHAGDSLKLADPGGFHALPGGVYYLNRSRSFNGFSGFFWSSTMAGPAKAWAHGVNTVNHGVSSYPAYRPNAFSLRCIKD